MTTFDESARHTKALRAALDQSVERAGRLRRVQWLAFRLTLECKGSSTPRSAGARGLGSMRDDALAAFGSWAGPERFYWEHPAAARAVASQGALHAIECGGAGRFADASRLVRSLFEDLEVVGDPAPPSAGPLLVGGFAFRDEALEDRVRGRDSFLQPALREWSEFPPGRLVLPERMVVVDDDHAHWTLIHAIVPGASADAEWNSIAARLADWGPRRVVATPAGRSGDCLGPEYRVRSDRPHRAFLEQVHDALSAIEEGELEKVVLARSLKVRSDEPLEVVSLLDDLRRVYPSCVTFAVRRDRSLFLGATPEQLVGLRGGRVRTAALAGSARRGRSPEEDQQLGVALLENPKERFEHAAVVRGIRASLAEFCGPVEHAAIPDLRRLEGIQHLETPLSGRLLDSFAKSATVLDLVGCLHPTPAVGGLPREAAEAWIDAHEGMDRGWYAGPVGTVDGDGGGDFRVALRSALVSGCEARLFAGAGIVAGSEPESELVETRQKLRALLAPLTDI